MGLIGRRALIGAGLAALAAPIAFQPTGADAVLFLPTPAPVERVKPLGQIWLADRKPTVQPGETLQLGVWIRPAGNVDDAVFRYWRDSCWFPVANTEVDLGPLAAAGAVLTTINLAGPSPSQIQWKKIKHKGADWWRATVQSDGRLNNGHCIGGVIPDTGVGVPPGGTAKIGVSISCEVYEGPQIVPGTPQPRVQRRRSQFRFVLTIAATAPP